MEYDEDRPVPQKSVEGPAPDVQPDAAKVNALPPEETCMAAEAGDTNWAGDDNSRGSERTQSSQHHNDEMQIQEHAAESQDSAVTEEFAVARHSTDKSSQEHCEEDGVTAERQDNSYLAAERCGLGEVCPHLHGVSIPTLPVGDLETEYAAHEAPPRPRTEETQPSGRVPRHGENCGCQECQIEMTDGKVVDVEHEAESELEREGNCAHSPLLRPGGMIFLEDACKNESANVAHEATMIAEGVFFTEERDELESGYE